MSKRRTFSIKQKLQVLREAESEGMLNTCRKYEIAQSLFYRWKNQFDKDGIDGLQAGYRKVNPEVKTLEQENERLKKIVARQALELEVKSELLKKTEQLKKQGKWS
jgi:transposase-like protein